MIMAARYDSTSRYAIDANNRTASRVKLPQSATTTVHVAQQGDTLENLAARILGDSRRFWEIADLNPQIKFPLDIKLGTPIRLPL